MSRIPKFKCWIAATKKILVLESTTEAHNHYLQTGSGGFWLYTSDTGKLIASSEAGDILLEFAGLPDKNGKEIYEGDILGCTYEDIAEESGYYHIRVSVVFQNGAFGWVGDVTGKFHPFCHEPLEDHEVVGNIYENPELLKP